MNFYFTYGYSESQVFKGGWTKVMAPNEEIAIREYLKFHPLVDGLIPCAFIYNEEQMKETGMLRDGNLGYRCHEAIYVK